MIEVEDNGAGIAPEDVENIFNVFVSRKGGRGTGLRLSVTKKIVEEHGGRVEVQSEQDRGSCFTVILPANVVTDSDQIDIHRATHAIAPADLSGDPSSEVSPQG